MKTKRTLFILLTVIVAATIATYLRIDSRIIEPSNIILISIDTCRADHLSCYGYSRKTTPAIDAVAKGGVLFEQVISPVPITLPAHCSMLTGTIPPDHGVHDNVENKLDQSNVTLAEILKAEGFGTAAIVSTFVLDSQFGLSQGFDTYNDQFEVVRYTSSTNERLGGETSRVANEWLEEHKNEKFFLFLHYYDPHDQYRPPEPFASTFADNLYAGEIAYTDHCIGQVVNKLKELKLYDSSLLIIAGDHGEMRGEHGEQEHTYFIYESAIKVPLIFKLPGASHHSRKMTQTVGLIDIVPTVCSLLGIDSPAEMQGQDLSPYLLEKEKSEEERGFYCESVTPLRLNANPLLGIRTNRWKYIHTTRDELYDLTKDPGETNNLAATEPHQAKVLESQLRERIAGLTQKDGSSSQADLDDESLARLRSLGYIASSNDEVSFADEDFFDLDPDRDDPKDHIDFFVQLQHATGLNFDFKFKEARTILDELARNRPGIFEIHMQLAFAAGGLNDHETAFENLHRALVLKPGNTVALADLGFIALKQDKIEEAIEYSLKAIEGDPGNTVANDTLGTISARKGDFEKAQSYYRKSLDVNPINAATHSRLAGVFALQENLDLAVDHYKTALKINPALSNARKNLGTILIQQGNIEEGLQHCVESLESDPNQPQPLNNWAWLIATSKQASQEHRQQALDMALQACQFTKYEKANYLDTLAVVYASLGKFTQAIETAEKALTIAGVEGDDQFKKEITKSLKFYKQGKPYSHK